MYNKSSKKYTKPKFRRVDSVRISKNYFSFRKGFKPQFTNEIFEISALSTKKAPTYIIKDLEKEILGKFCEKELRK